MRFFGWSIWWFYPAFLLTAVNATERFFDFGWPAKSLAYFMGGGLSVYVASAASLVALVLIWRLPHRLKGPYRIISLCISGAWLLTLFGLPGVPGWEAYGWPRDVELWQVIVFWVVVIAQAGVHMLAWRRGAITNDA